MHVNISITNRYSFSIFSFFILRFEQTTFTNDDMFKCNFFMYTDCVIQMSSKFIF